MGSQVNFVSEPLLVDTIELGTSIAEKLANERVLGFDCEGVDLGPLGNLTLIQISTWNGSIYVFDIYVCPQLAEILRAIMESTTIVKIIHDCRGERSNLRQQFGIALRSVYDTQIAFHFLKPDKNDRISLTNLSKYFKAPPNPLKGEFQNSFYEANPGFWARRPLTEKMIKYAAADVANLHFFYNKMQIFANNLQFRSRCETANLTEADIAGPDGRRNPNLRFFI